MTDECRAYQSLLDQPKAVIELRSEIEALSAEGSAAARVYAALLLRSIDEDAGREALSEMVAPGSRLRCTVFPGGCSGFGSTLSEVAEFLLGR